MSKFIALHNHWISAVGAKQFLQASAPLENPFSRLEPELLKLAQRNAELLRLCNFYALMYVVIEGYQKADIKDETLDRLLSNSEQVELLKLCRHSVFHYHKNPLSSQLLGFLRAPNSGPWIRAVYDAFEELFEEKLPVKETFEYLRKHHSEASSLG
jgi:hypothetical protein